MPKQESKIVSPESWEDKKSEKPESWSDVDELGEIQTELLRELMTVKYGVVISPIFKTASGGERIQINKGAMKAYDSDNRVVWQLLQNTNENILTLNKRDDDGYGNALNIQDDSDDGNASLNIEYTGNSATKDLIHLELMSTMTQARVGMSIELEGGTVQALASLHAKAGTATDVLYLESDIAAGNCIHAFSDNASNTDPVGYFRSDGVVSTNYYKIFGFDGAGSVQPNVWIANNADPNGNLTDVAGSICLSTNGNIYRCTGTNNWTAM